MKKTLSFLLLCLTATAIKAQPDIVWEKSFGGTWTDDSGDILVADDGNYLALCNPSSPDGDFVGGHGYSDMWLMKLDQSGQKIWQKSYGGSQGDYASRIISSGDGGYLILGSTISNDDQVSGNHGKNDIWLVKINQAGDLLWQKTYGGSENDGAKSILPTNDGGFIITSSTESNDLDVPADNHGGVDLWVFKINAGGEILWSNLYGGSNVDSGGTIRQTTDNGFLISGSSDSGDGDVPANNGGRDIWILKIDSIGTIEWKTGRGGTDNDYSNGFVITDDGGYLFANFTASTNGSFFPNHGGFDAWVFKLNAYGAFQWEKFYGGSGWELMNGIFKMENGNCILMGQAQSMDGDLAGNTNPNAWLLCIDQSGNILWKKTYGGSNSETFSRIRQNGDNGFLVMGTSGSYDGDVQSGVPGHYGDIWVLGMSLISAVDNAFSKPTELKIVPNPASDYMEILSEEQFENCIFSIVSTDGAVLLRQSLDASRRIDVSALPDGMYFAQAVTVSGKVCSGKFRKQK